MIFYPELNRVMSVQARAYSATILPRNQPTSTRSANLPPATPTMSATDSTGSNFKTTPFTRKNSRVTTHAERLSPSENPWFFASAYV